MKIIVLLLLPEMQLFRRGWERLGVAPVTLQWLVIDWNGWAKLHNECKVTGSWSWQRDQTGPSFPLWGAYCFESYHRSEAAATKKALHSHHGYLKLTEGSRGGRVCMYTRLMTHYYSMWLPDVRRINTVLLWITGLTGWQCESRLWRWIKCVLEVTVAFNNASFHL